MIRALWMVSLVALAPSACSRMTLQPRLVVDDNFTDEEAAALVEAVDGWTAVVPDVRAQSYTRMSHAKIEEFARQSSLADDEILVLATSATDCPAGPMPSGELGVRHEGSSNDSSIICVNVDGARARGAHEAHATVRDVFRATFSHELGHAFGLHHDDSRPLIMNSESHEDVRTVATCEDARKLADVWGLSVAEICR